MELLFIFHQLGISQTCDFRILRREHMSWWLPCCSAHMSKPQPWTRWFCSASEPLMENLNWLWVSSAISHELLFVKFLVNVYVSFAAKGSSRYLTIKNHYNTTPNTNLQKAIPEGLSGHSVVLRNQTLDFWRSPPKLEGTSFMAGTCNVPQQNNKTKCSSLNAQ